ncbi:hydrolase [Mycolicibacterium doricum]|uniref:Hydrolase n=1 Tax=Mycolicibacterium doricum TaxID=126673 RepID=A0A1X1SWG7_9MYCO|nr:carbon-nitrogen hydrolase family protein [Mycolicibacterium doricum]MCV7267910.1 carbon-nitrogen hydrolase family protein [Mycolicibacterium doricum]ORV35258.1 hydrolase [Mycolicibacterium doricum]BBZ06159.1 hydrolase [Mycolicibacterium doricum]
MRIACAQIAAGTHPAANLEVVEHFTGRAVDAGAELVLFPEATMCRFGVPLAPVAEPLDGPWPTAVRSIADRAGVTVVTGMFTPSGDGRVLNTLLATGGGVDSHYHKIHLYDAFGFRESRTVAAGSEPVTITVGGVVVGLTTCYDIRFPELYVELARRGAELITVHASWGAGPGKLDQWTLLARARALDATGYLAAVDQAYPDDEVAASGPTGIGGSLVASATGDVVVSAGAEPELLVADLDLDAARTVRETIAVLSNRAEAHSPGTAESRA